MIQIYKASAGSGKTFTLAREYIKLILGYKTDDGVYHLRKSGARALHRSVLAITFTNKATEEMKSRIIHELAVLAGAEKGWKEKSKYCDDLCRHLNCSEAELSRAAGETLRELLYDFSNFNVSTIDSFFQMVLRSFAHEAEVSSNYEVELDDSGVIGMSIDNLLQDLNHVKGNKDLRRITEWLTRFMTKLVEEGSGFNIFNRSSQVHVNLIRFIADISDDTYRDNETLILNYLRDGSKIDGFMRSIEGRIDALKTQTAAACQAAAVALRAVNPIGPGKGTVNNNIAGPIVNWARSGYFTSGSKQQAELSATVYSAIENLDNAYVKGAVNSPHRATLDPLISDALASIKKCAGEVGLLKIISANIYQLGLLAKINEYVDKYRSENSAILLSDTNALLSKVIGDSDSPFLYEKMGTRFKHYLIDEFQDTSHSQWHNLRHLVDESIANGHDNLVIGDEKQCIYRFRGSDPSLLHNLHSGRKEEEYSIRGEKIEDNKNWRSSANVVNFNNSLFERIAAQNGFSDIYAGVRQQVEKTELPGYVRLELLESKRNDTEANEKALRTLADNLRRQLESGYRPKDIAILVRYWNEGEKVISYLEEIKQSDTTFPTFNIVSDSSLLISNSPAIMLIVSRLRYLSAIDFTSRKNRCSSREVTRVINDFESTFAQTKSATQSLLEAINLHESRRQNNPGETTAEVNEDNTALDLTTLVETIVARYVPEDNRLNEAIYITAFQDLVTDFVAKGRSDIRSFLDWWDEKGKKISVSGAANDPSALNILTIHKSKGLEYPCVHVPFAGFTDSSGHVDRAWFEIPDIEGIPEDFIPPMAPLNITKAMTRTPLNDQYQEYLRQKMLDNINLLYVAFTRASNELIVSVKLNFTTKGELTAGLPKVISDALRANLLKGGNLYETGSPTIKKADKEKERSAISPDEGDHIASYEVNAIDSPWEKTRLERKKNKSLRVARERGIILHDILSLIQTPEDIDVAFRMSRASDTWNDITDAEAAELKDIVTRRVNDDKAIKWFRGFRRALREREVKTDRGDIKRFDRVVWTDDGQIHLIDYKTGSQPPKRYKRQLQTYLKFFKSIGYPGVRAFLYYLDSGDIVEVDE